MALIACPYCGEKLSNRAAKCPHCGNPLTPAASVNTCMECGAVLDVGETVCHQCGCPVEQEKTSAAARPTKKKHHWGRLLLILLAVVGIGWYLAKEYQEEQYNKQVAEQINTYISIITEVETTYNEGVGVLNDSEDLMLDVWYNAIWKIRDERTDPFTRPKGYFSGDFNDALELLYEDESFKANLQYLSGMEATLRENRIKIQSLSYIPEQMETYTDYEVELIDGLIRCIDIVLRPVGSYNDVQDEINDIIEQGNDIMREMSAIVATQSYE